MARIACSARIPGRRPLFSKLDQKRGQRVRRIDDILEEPSDDSYEEDVDGPTSKYESSSSSSSEEYTNLHFSDRFHPESELDPQEVTSSLVDENTNSFLHGSNINPIYIGGTSCLKEFGQFFKI